MILRVVEMEGKKSQTPAAFSAGNTGFQTANLLEEPTGESVARQLTINPFEISTVRLQR